MKKVGWVYRYRTYSIKCCHSNSCLGNSLRFKGKKFMLMAIWLLTNFFAQLPKGFEEAAAIDGCSRGKIFFTIMLPLIKPAIFSVALIVFINAWNEYLYALTFMTNDEMRTVPVGIALFPSNYELPWGDMAAATVVVTVPLYASWYKVICDGKLGELQNINISSLHGYHGASIIRQFLNVGFGNLKLYGKRYWFDVTETYGRDGMVFDREVVKCSRDRVTMEFDNGKTAFFDFSDPAQYHSFIRTRQLTVQGTRGEIDDLTIRYLNEQNVPVTQTLNRIDLGVYGNQEWSHYGVMLGEEFLFKTPFKNARFNDDEIAVGSCLMKMHEYVKTGKEFYGLADALQDMYICLKMEEAYANPLKVIETETQPWAK